MNIEDVTNIFLTKNCSEKWFKDQLSEAIKNAGSRYTPELNIELPIAEKFETLGRSKIFYDN